MIAARAVPRTAPANWPHREHSRWHEVDRLNWHVQTMGEGPPVVLLHGTGASTHSFREVMPKLAERFKVIAPDLPGHGFSSAPPDFVPSLPEIARALARLLEALEVDPLAWVGHSAGTAVALDLTLARPGSTRIVIGLASALVPPRGLAGAFFHPAAKLLASSALPARFLASRAMDVSNVERLVANTGSRLDPLGVQLYGRLASTTAHVEGVLAMLANWDLRPLYAELPRIKLPLMLIAGATDRATPVVEQRQIVARVPGAKLVVLPDTGHLLHEERPERVAGLIRFALGEALA